MMLFHIIKHIETWKNFLKRGRYVPQSYHEQGYVHLCRAEQILEVIENHFSEEEELILLMIPQKRVKWHIIWEDVGHGIFPHLYSPLSLDVIESTAYIHKVGEGEYSVMMEDGSEIPLNTFLKRFFSKKRYTPGFRFYE